MVTIEAEDLQLILAERFFYHSDLRLLPTQILEQAWEQESDADNKIYIGLSILQHVVQLVEDVAYFYTALEDEQKILKYKVKELRDFYWQMKSKSDALQRVTTLGDKDDILQRANEDLKEVVEKFFEGGYTYLLNLSNLWTDVHDADGRLLSIYLNYKHGAKVIFPTPSASLIMNISAPEIIIGRKSGGDNEIDTLGVAGLSDEETITGVMKIARTTNEFLRQSALMYLISASSEDVAKMYLEKVK